MCLGAYHFLTNNKYPSHEGFIQHWKVSTHREYLNRDEEQDEEERE